MPPNAENVQGESAKTAQQYNVEVFYSIIIIVFTNTYLVKFLFQDCNCQRPNHIHQFLAKFHNNWWVVSLLISSHRPCFHLAHNHALNQVQFLPVRFKNFLWLITIKNHIKIISFQIIDLPLVRSRKRSVGLTVTDMENPIEEK